MIRFRTSQLPDLPPHDQDLWIELPDGRVVDGHFRRHPANPNVSGSDLVRYIKRVLPFGQNRPMMVDASGKRWKLLKFGEAMSVVKEARVSTRRLFDAKLTGSDLAKLLKWADSEEQAAQRRVAYTRLLRPAGLRRMILALMGADCQVDTCTAAADMRKKWLDTGASVAILEVHHIEAMAQRVDHHPNNLCVLCANHHALIHGHGPWGISHEGNSVVFSVGTKAMRIDRDLSFIAS